MSKFSKNLARCITAGISSFFTIQVSAYDNSRFPPFETSTAGRGFQHLSIHPNGEDWLITECSKKFTNQEVCYLLIYNLKKKSYQRFGLSMEHNHIDGRFSPSGKQILMVRQPVSKKIGKDGVLESFSQGQIAVMNIDGSNFRTLPIPSHRVMRPTMSSDETKIAYLVAGSDKPVGRWTNFTNYEIWEFDLTRNRNEIFAGPMKFYHATTVSYLSESQIIVGAMAPAHTGSSKRPDYVNQYNASEIFKINRGMPFAPEPSFYDLPNANFPSPDDAGNIFFETQPEKIGAALTRKNSKGQTTIWREPKFNLCSVSQYVAAASGAYVGFIYGGDLIKTATGSRALGYFDVASETWIPVSPPLIENSISLP